MVLGIVLALVAIDVAIFALGRENAGRLLARQLLNALCLGGIYALIAVGYSLIYGIVKLINFAHGEIYMLGAFFGILLIGDGFSFASALLVAMVGAALVAMAMDQIAYRPLRQDFRAGVLVPAVAAFLTLVGASIYVYQRGQASFTVAFLVVALGALGFILVAERFVYLPTSKPTPRLSALITAIGMSLFLQNAAMLAFGAESRPFPSLDSRRELVIALEGGAGADDTAPTAPGRGSATYAASYGRPLAPADLALAETELRRACDALAARRLDEVPFLYARASQERALAAAIAAGAADVAEKQAALAALDASLARLEEARIEACEGRILVVLELSADTPDPASQELRRDLKAWLRNPAPAPGRAVLKPGLGLEGRSELGISDRAFTHPFERNLVTSEALTVPVKVVFLWAAAVIILVAMTVLVHRTRFGMAMRAVALDKDAARLMGVNVDRVILATFALSGAMAAVAGVLFGLYIGSGISYRMGYYAGVMAFFAAVLGGIGSLKGAVLGGVILGGVQAISEAYVTDWATHRIRQLAGLFDGAGLDYTFNSQYAYAIACVILISVILVKPSGIFGASEIDRA